MKYGLGKKTACLAITAALALTAFVGIGSSIGTPKAAAAGAEDYGLVENIQDGVILHCFDWKYTDIIEELDNIAKAGFSTIQTSPVQPAGGTGPWYWLYQPTAFSVAENGDLGTAAELKELCEKAEQYGIKVVVDVVANHLAGDHDAIQQDLVADEYWHDYGPCKQYSDRTQVIMGDIGMQDLNTENTYVQQVVADYVNSLKELGVDGIRWDAAKHIGLPSEGSEFWSTVTASGLYNYGEILNSPFDGGGTDLMKEYTKYMSVTDNEYGSMLVTAFNAGKVPTADGNWTDDGISPNKLVYWGESHDTYSNEEGRDTNAVSQNVIDKAYAVAAAREGASALYLSRPFATARESIRVGVKGSTHFNSPEIASVNHFHNAMVGKAEKYGSSDNCAVVTRENGGAVIVHASGSGAVNVENLGGYVPAGTYYDEVTGNEFTVTETTISGTVGASGIAVVYDSDFLSKVYAEPDTDSNFVNSLKVTLHAVSTDDARYTVTAEGENRMYASGSFKDGDVITVGEEMPANKTAIVTLTCTGKNGKEVSAVYRYNKKEDRTMPDVEAGGIVFDNSIAKWSKINVYVYDESGSTTITNEKWPGAVMTDCGEDYYSYQLPEQFASCEHIMVIFNNGNGDQIPGAMQDGMTMKYTDKKLYDGTKWMNYPEKTKPVEESSQQSSDESSQTSQASQTSQESSTSQAESSSESQTSVVIPSNPDSKPVSTSDNTAGVAFAIVGIGSAAAAAYVLLSGRKREE